MTLSVVSTGDDSLSPRFRSPESRRSPDHSRKVYDFMGDRQGGLPLKGPLIAAPLRFEAGRASNAQSTSQTPATPNAAGRCHSPFASPMMSGGITRQRSTPSRSYKGLMTKSVGGSLFSHPASSLTCHSYSGSQRVGSQAGFTSVTPCQLKSEGHLVRAGLDNREKCDLRGDAGGTWKLESRLETIEQELAALWSGRNDAFQQLDEHASELEGLRSEHHGSSQKLLQHAKLLEELRSDCSTVSKRLRDHTLEFDEQRTDDDRALHQLSFQLNENSERLRANERTIDDLRAKHARGLELLREDQCKTWKKLEDQSKERPHKAEMEHNQLRETLANVVSAVAELASDHSPCEKQRAAFRSAQETLALEVQSLKERQTVVSEMVEEGQQSVLASVSELAAVFQRSLDELRDTVVVDCRKELDSFGSGFQQRWEEASQRVTELQETSDNASNHMMEIGQKIDGLEAEQLRAAASVSSEVNEVARHFDASLKGLEDVCTYSLEDVKGSVCELEARHEESTTALRAALEKLEIAWRSDLETLSGQVAERQQNTECGAGNELPGMIRSMQKFFKEFQFKVQKDLESQRNLIASLRASVAIEQLRNVVHDAEASMAMGHEVECATLCTGVSRMKMSRLEDRSESFSSMSDTGTTESVTDGSEKDRSRFSVKERSGFEFPVVHIGGTSSASCSSDGPPSCRQMYDRP